MGIITYTKRKIDQLLARLFPLSGGTLDAGAAISFSNGSYIHEGNAEGQNNRGGNGGIQQVCSVGYPLRWEAGRLWLFEPNGFTVRAVLYQFSDPSPSDDITRGFATGSQWIKTDGTVFECFNDTEDGNADWRNVGYKALNVSGPKGGMGYSHAADADGHWYTYADSLDGTQEGYVAVSPTFVEIGCGGNGANTTFVVGPYGYEIDAAKFSTALGLTGTLVDNLAAKADLVDGLVPANQLPASLALGETSTTAYRGDRGRTAYDHSQSTGNAHNLTAANVRSILGVSALMGSNTGDQDLSAYATTSAVAAAYQPLNSFLTTVAGINATTGTGALARAASPTFTGTLNAAAIATSGNLTVGNSLGTINAGAIDCYLANVSSINSSFGGGASGMRLVGNWGVYWTAQSAGSVNVYAITPDVFITRGGTGLFDVRTDNGLRVRNYANNADANLSAAAATFSATSRDGVYTVATLPSASANASAWATVTDSNSTTNGGTVAGGGSNRVPVFSNGTNWIIK